METCTSEQHKRLLKLCSQVEKFAVEGGIILIKLWLEVGMEEQEIRFNARIEDPRGIGSEPRWTQNRSAAGMITLGRAT
jgi:polyphosphate kinase 2 (PPK2 family)